MHKKASSRTFGFMPLQFESLLMIGPDEEDVATKSFVGVGEAAVIGAQRTTIAEQPFGQSELT
jgi:hypothetical protein